jgi:hypothetical protein
MEYIRLEDLIAWAIYTWGFSFSDIEEDLYDVLRIALKNGIDVIGIDLGSNKVVYLSEYDLTDVVDYLVKYVEEILESINSNEYVDLD